jgi:hypothetical protein
MKTVVSHSSLYYVDGSAKLLANNVPRQRNYEEYEDCLNYFTSTGISFGYPIDVSCDPVGYPSWMSYVCLQDVLMSSPMDVKRVYP